MTIPCRHCLPWLCLLLLPVPVSVAKPGSDADSFLFVGTYTRQDSKGIYVYREARADSKLTPLGVAAETVNPSFLAIDPTHRFLYAVNEIADYKGEATGAVSAFSIDVKTGKLTLLNQVASRGTDPCYLAFDKTGRYALVANYTGGSVAVFHVQADGRIGQASAFIQHAGSSVNPERQQGPHAHWIETTPDNRFAIAVDLGVDELRVYRFDADNGSLAPNNPPYAKLDPGAGPRHLAFSPDGKFAYVVNELQSSITAFSYDSSHGALEKLATVATVPKGFSGNNDAAEIHVHPNGKFLFASNRGNDSIAVFSIHRKTGALTLVDHFPTQGKNPLNFEIEPSGKLLLVANQDGNSIVEFKIDSRSGRLTPTGRTLSVPSPVSLKFMPAE